MTFKYTGELLGVDHATIIHGCKNTINFMTLGESDYTNAMVDWRLIFDENHIDISNELDARQRIKARIVNIISDGIVDRVIDVEEREQILKEVLASMCPTPEETEEISLY
jgi:hypothetical protein